MRRGVAEELPALEEAGELVNLALGALSCAARLDALLNARAPGASAGSRKFPAPPDPALAALLGLVSLRRTLLRWLGAASAETLAPDVRGGTPPPSWQNAPGGWLR